MSSIKLFGKTDENIGDYKQSFINGIKKLIELGFVDKTKGNEFIIKINNQNEFVVRQDVINLEKNCILILENETYKNKLNIIINSVHGKNNYVETIYEIVSLIQDFIDEIERQKLNDTKLQAQKSQFKQIKEMQEKEKNAQQEELDRLLDML